MQYPIWWNNQVKLWSILRPDWGASVAHIHGGILRNPLLTVYHNRPGNSTSWGNRARFKGERVLYLRDQPLPPQEFRELAETTREIVFNGAAFIWKDTQTPLEHDLMKGNLFFSHENGEPFFGKINIKVT